MLFLATQTMRIPRLALFRALPIVLILCLFGGPRSIAAGEPLLHKKQADRISRAAQAAHLRNVLVADFLDSSGARTDRGVFLAAEFARTFAERTRDFSTVNREKWDLLLESRSIVPGDVVRPDGLRRIGAALGCDGVVTGSLSQQNHSIRVVISLREVSTGAELATADYEQKQDLRFEGNFPAAHDPSGIRYYFVGLDGIGQPKCIRCDNPFYSSEARAKRIQGSVLVSMLIDSKGDPEQLRLLAGSDPRLDANVLVALKRWKFEPVLDPSGQPVPLRFCVEVIFSLS